MLSWFVKYYTTELRKTTWFFCEKSYAKVTQLDISVLVLIKGSDTEQGYFIFIKPRVHVNIYNLRDQPSY